MFSSLLPLSSGQTSGKTFISNMDEDLYALYFREGTTVQVATLRADGVKETVKVGRCASSESSAMIPSASNEDPQQ